MNRVFKIICTAALAVAANTSNAATISITGTVELSPLYYNNLISISGRLNLAEQPIFASGDDVHLKINFSDGKAIRMGDVPSPYPGWDIRHFGAAIKKADGMPLGGWGAPDTKTSRVQAHFTGWRSLKQLASKPVSMPIPGLFPDDTGLGVSVGSWAINFGEPFEFTGIEASFHIEDLGVAPDFAEMVFVGAFGFASEVFLVDATDGGNPAQVPEPSSAMLAGVGLMGLATVLRRRRK